MSTPRRCPVRFDPATVFERAAELALAIWRNRPSVSPPADPFDSVLLRATDAPAFHLGEALKRPQLNAEQWHQALDAAGLTERGREGFTLLYAALDWERDGWRRDGSRSPGALRSAFERLSDGLALLAQELPEADGERLAGLCEQLRAAWGWPERAGVRPAGGAAQEQRRPRKPGRPHTRDHEAEKRLYRDWQASGLPKKEFARRRGLSFQDVAKAIGNHLRRQSRQAKRSGAADKPPVK